MKSKMECSIKACEVQNISDNASIPKVITLNMETGMAYKENIQKNRNEKEDILKNNKNKNIEESSTRLLQIIKSENSVYGFHLTRTKWDPYPWVSVVDATTPAEISGLKVGDCVLEVNGEDVLGLRITDIAKLVRAKSEHVTLLLWNAGCESKCDPESLCDGPMPLTLQRLSIIVQSILSIIECPVCLDTIPPPAMQCQNGHLLCVNCRIRAEKCPVCRDRYTPRRALIAEQIYAAITNAFNLCRTEDKLRHKLFGTNVKHMKQQEQEQQNSNQQQFEEQKSIVNMVTTSMDKEEYPRALENTIKSRCRTGAEVCKSATKAQGNGNGTGTGKGNAKERFGLQLPTNKFLTKLLFSKAYSMDNLSSATTTGTTAQTQSTNTDGLLVSYPATPSTLVVNSSSTNSLLPTMSATLTKARSSSTTAFSNDLTNQGIQSCSNQSHSKTTTNMWTPNTIRNCTNSVPEIEEKNIDCLDDETARNLVKNKITKVNGLSKNFSLSTNDLLEKQKHRKSSYSHLTTTELDGFIIATKVKPQCTLNSDDLLQAIQPKAQTIESLNLTSSFSILDKSLQRKCTIASSKSSQCGDTDESINMSTSFGDDISLASSSQSALSTTVKAPLNFPYPDLDTLSGTSSDASNSIDDFLSTSTPSTATASSSTSSTS